MTRTFNVRLADGTLVERVTEDQVLVMVDRGQLGGGSPAIELGIPGWRELGTFLDPAALAAPPLPKAPPPVIPPFVPPSPGGLKELGRQKIDLTDIISVTVCGLILALFTLAFSSYSDANVPFLVGKVLGMSILAAVLYLPLRIWFRRGLSAGVTIGAILLLVIVLGASRNFSSRSKVQAQERAAAEARDQAERKLNEPLDLQPASPGRFVKVLAPGSFRTQRLTPPKDGALVSILSYRATSPRLSVEVIEYDFKSGYQFLPKVGLASVLKSIQGNALPGSETVRPASPCTIDKGPAFDASISMRNLGTDTTVYSYWLTAFGAPRGSAHPPQGVLIAVTASYPDQARNEMEIGRVMRSILRIK